MPRNGNMKPDRSSDGRKKKVSFIAWVWLRATLLTDAALDFAGDAGARSS